MISGLKLHQAVQVNDDLLLVKLDTYKEYKVEDTHINTNNNSSNFYIGVNSKVYLVTRLRKRTTSYVLKDGTELTVEKYQEKRKEIFGKYYSSYDDELYFPDTETELRIKGNWIPYEKPESIYSEPEEILEPVEITIVGAIEDTGSKYITTPILLGKTTWNYKSGFYRVNITRATYDVWCELASKYKDVAVFDNTDRNYLRWAKVDGTYLFNDSYTERQYSYHTTLEEAQTSLNRWEKIVRTKILDKIKPKSINDKQVSEVINLLNKTYNDVQAIDSKVKTQSEQNGALRRLRERINELETYLEREHNEPN